MARTRLVCGGGKQRAIQESAAPLAVLAVRPVGACEFSLGVHLIIEGFKRDVTELDERERGLGW